MEYAEYGDSQEEEKAEIWWRKHDGYVFPCM